MLAVTGAFECTDTRVNSQHQEMIRRGEAKRGEARRSWSRCLSVGSLVRLVVMGAMMTDGTEWMGRPIGVEIWSCWCGEAC